MGSWKFVEVKLSVAVTSGRWGRERCSASLAQKSGVCYISWKVGKGKRRAVSLRRTSTDMCQALPDLNYICTINLLQKWHFWKQQWQKRNFSLKDQRIMVCQEPQSRLWASVIAENGELILKGTFLKSYFSYIQIHTCTQSTLSQHGIIYYNV